MDKLTLRDVRCFRGEVSTRLAPLTFLVGENSTGKSTLLAFARVAWDIAYGLSEPDFNEEPFALGAYDELAHYHGGRGKRAKTFGVGFLMSRREMPGQHRSQDAQDIEVVGSFGAVGGQPTLQDVTFKRPDRTLRVEASEDKVRVQFESPSGRCYQVAMSFDFHSRPLSASHLFFLLDVLRYRSRTDPDSQPFEGEIPPQKELDEFVRMLSGFRHRVVGRRGSRGSGRPIAVAPIRTKPRRIYDRLREDRSPEGDHTPMLLARLNETDSSGWQKLAGSLSIYGQASGLFRQVNVQRFGRREAAPFQLRVKLADQHREVNLVDVGYGVSQILPILVDCLVEERSSFFLMQQPEVHLHPKAQAELGSFFVEMVKSRRQRFMIETHSDYILDRVRMEVRDGRIGSEDVAIVFLEREAHGVKAHNLSLDQFGNITDQPDGYRQFFLEEELRFIR